jgi:hypothetical protein
MSQLAINQHQWEAMKIMYNQQLFTNQYTQTFSNVYDTYDKFLNDYQNLGIPQRLKNTDFLKTIYILLAGEYASSSIMSFSEDQFRLKLFTLVMSYGPQYEKELDIQDKLLAMTDEELQVSSKAIYNSAFNPSVEPSTDTMDELQTINQQNVTKHKRSKLDAYALLTDLLNADLTKQFIKRFDHLFVRVLRTNQPLYYTTTIQDTEDDI